MSMQSEPQNAEDERASYWRSFFDIPNLLSWLAAYLSVVAGVGIMGSHDGAGSKLFMLCAALPIFLDFVDGAIARRFFRDAPGRRIGSVLDTLADFAAFGCLPATILLGVLGTGFVVWATAAVWVFCAQMRLAHFSYSEGRMPPGIFLGMPTPYAAGLLLVGITLARRYAPDAALIVLCVGTTIVASLMLFPFRFRKPSFVWNIAFAIGVVLVVALLGDQ